MNAHAVSYFHTVGLEDRWRNARILSRDVKRKVKQCIRVSKE